MHRFTPSRTRAAARRFAVACAIGAGLVATSHAQTYTESGDAGQTQASAQSTLGASGPLTDIYGSFSSSLDADLFVINILNPASFSATTFNLASGDLDTQLFLLTMAGAPVIFNDDDAGGLSLLSTLPAGAASLVAGQYILGVAVGGYNPVNINSQHLFAEGLPTTVRGPASGLQPAVLGGFSDETYDTESGGYRIQLSGVGTATIPAVPEPATSALFVAGGALCAFVVRRRRDAAATGRASA